MELVRSKTGIALGELVNFLTIIKGLPVGYNRDLQDTKPPAIRVAHVLSLSIPVMTIVIKDMQLNHQTMLEAASNPELMATDLVEYLVIKGMPFREAHDVSAQVVQHARDHDCPMPKLDLSVYKTFCPLFTEDVFDVFDAHKSLTEKNSPGSTGFKAVSQALAQAKQRLKEFAH